MHLRRRLPTSDALRGAATLQARAFWRARVERARRYAVPVLQVALAAAAAWELGVLLLPTDRPVFAAVMAISSLGVAIGNRGKLALEMVIGVAIGLGVAELAIAAVGRGPVQIGVLAALAMLLTVLLGGGPATIGQAGVWAVLVATFHGPGRLFPEALLEALLGGAVALAFSQLIFPLHPLRTSSGAMRVVLAELADRLRDGSRALRDGDEETAARARLALLDLERHIADLGQALAMSAGAARLAPARRKYRGAVQSFVRVSHHLGLAAQDAGSLLSAAARLIRHGEDAPTLDEALDDLACACDRLIGVIEDGDDPSRARRFLFDAVHRAPEAFDPNQTPSALVCWALIQSLAHHLLVAAGMDEAEARDAIGGEGASGGGERSRLFDRIV